MFPLSPTLRETLVESLARALAAVWIGGFFVAVEVAVLRLIF